MKQLSLVALVALTACGNDDPSPTIYFDLGNTATQETFWNFPFPSDQRLDANGRSARRSNERFGPFEVERVDDVDEQERHTVISCAPPGACAGCHVVLELQS